MLRQSIVLLLGLLTRAAKREVRQYAHGENICAVLLMRLAVYRRGTRIYAGNGDFVTLIGVWASLKFSVFADIFAKSWRNLGRSVRLVVTESPFFEWESVVMVIHQGWCAHNRRIMFPKRRIVLDSIEWCSVHSGGRMLSGQSDSCSTIWRDERDPIPVNYKATADAQPGVSKLEAKHACPHHVSISLYTWPAFRSSGPFKGPARSCDLTCPRTHTRLEANWKPCFLPTR